MHPDGVGDILLLPDEFATVMAQQGIGDDTLVVAYAETDHSGAARLWWALHYYGHEQVVVLNGGWTKWLAEQRPISTTIPQFAPTTFTSRPQKRWLATADDVAQALHDPQIAVVDTRPSEQFAGLAVWTPEGSLYLPEGQNWVGMNGRKMRGGHLPGAIHLHATLNQDPAEQWCYHDPPSLRRRFEAAGLQPTQKIITYCGVGISASNGLLALYLAGYRDLALYDASWAEWGVDDERPIERPTSVAPTPSANIDEQS
jgi:thiosulfate/3-mercaptopyruvate sulfurtransferase